MRENEKNLGIGQLIDSLVSNEFTVSNKPALVAADLSRNLRKKFRFVDSVVLMGSSVHGGAVLRQVVRHEEADDLDWGIIYYGDSVSKEDLESLTEYSKKLIPQLASKRGLGKDFTSCGFVCARSFNAPKIMDLEDALEYIGDDELVEITPKNIRIRKQILSESEARKKLLGIK